MGKHRNTVSVCLLAAGGSAFTSWLPAVLLGSDQEQPGVSDYPQGYLPAASLASLENQAESWPHLVMYTGGDLVGFQGF